MVHDTGTYPNPVACARVRMWVWYRSQCAIPIHTVSASCIVSLSAPHLSLCASCIFFSFLVSFFLQVEGRYIPTDPKVAVDKKNASTFVRAQCGTAPYVCQGGPGYDPYAGKFGPDGNPNAYPYGPMDDKNSYSHGAKGESLKLFAKAQLPIKDAISQHFGVFNKLYTAVPTSSTPNHHFTQSGTSCGSTNNNDYQQCGGTTLLFPQLTMYDTDSVNFVFRVAKYLH